ncbi:glycosyltransferase family 9 protein [Fundidesulfovibrio butyratiphilus]
MQKSITMVDLLKMPQQDKAVVRHNGALGDFFLLWPTLRALSKTAWPGGLYWAGNSDRLAWLSPLGYVPCPPEILRALDGVFASDPRRALGALAGVRVFWPVLDKTPRLTDAAGIVFLPGLDQTGVAPVRQRYLRGLEDAGYAADGDWLKEFQRHFVKDRRPGNRVVVFPGAGHVRKQWPLVQFFQLAEILSRRGLDPLFVLGPAELERGLNPAPWPAVTPENDRELAWLLASARFVVGGDCGPMHLAGMLGVPGAALFGPTSFSQWGPVNMVEVTAGLACSPCTRTCADLDCPAPRCLEGIDSKQVVEILETMNL